MPDEPTAAWIDTDAALTELVEVLADQPRLAIDTEFHRERTFYPVCALVQIGWDGGRALVDPLAVDVRALAPILQGRTIVMHASGQDLELFRHSVGVVPDDLFDTQVAASFLGASSIGLAPLVGRMFDVDLPKADRLTDWLARPLGDGPKAYAESDVVYLFDIHDRQQAELAERGRTEWVTDECQRLVDKALADPDPDTAWWRIKEARRLKGRAAAVAQEVAKWREAQARADDRPVRTVLPDLALASIAQRPPKDERALGKIRGLRERGLAKSHRAGLLQAVADGLALDLDAVRTKTTVAVPSEYRPAVPLLMSWVSQRARQLDLDPAVLATRNDLEDFLRGDEDGRLATGWRRTALADDLDALLSGRGSLAFEPGTGLVMRLGD